MKTLLTLVAAGVCASTLTALPATASERPADGCPRGYSLTAVSVLQELAQEAPDSFFTGKDVNGDGFLCNKFLPDAAENVGLILENSVAHH